MDLNIQFIQVGPLDQSVVPQGQAWQPLNIQGTAGKYSLPGIDSDVFGIHTGGGLQGLIPSGSVITTTGNTTMLMSYMVLETSDSSVNTNVHRIDTPTVTSSFSLSRVNTVQTFTFSNASGIRSVRYATSRNVTPQISQDEFQANGATTFNLDLGVRTDSKSSEYQGEHTEYSITFEVTDVFGNEFTLKRNVPIVDGLMYINNATEDLPRLGFGSRRDSIFEFDFIAPNGISSITASNNYYNFRPQITYSNTNESGTMGHARVVIPASNWGNSYRNASGLIINQTGYDPALDVALLYI